MRQRQDSTFSYRGYHGFESHCRLRIWEEPGQTPVVLFTELDTNPGTSITNRIEHLAWEVYTLLERPRTGIRVIEHYPAQGPFWGKARTPSRREFIQEVTFIRTHEGFRSPCWQPVPREEVERLIGHSVED